MKIKMSASRRLFVIFNYVILTLLSLVFVLPMLSLVSTSLVSQAEIQERGNLFLFPRKIDYSAYKILLNKDSIVWNAYGITLFRVAVGTLIQMTVTCMLAYALSKKKLPFRGIITGFVLVPMFISGGLVPTYLLIKQLGLIDSLWVLVIPNAMSIYNMLLLRNFFMSIPITLEESAVLDGATPLRTLWSIILPLSLPSIMTIGMFYAVGHWNEWFDAAIYINSSSKLPMQSVMRNIVQQYTVSDLEAMSDEAMLNRMPQQTVQNATVVVATLPILVAYPFVQKYFIKGVMVGSLKG
jgi:putative aldouronate transport system permease protein